MCSIALTRFFSHGLLLRHSNTVTARRYSAILPAFCLNDTGAHASLAARFRSRMLPIEDGEVLDVGVAVPPGPVPSIWKLGPIKPPHPGFLDVLTQAIDAPVDAIVQLVIGATFPSIATAS